MATMSGGPSSGVVSAASSSFGQFRLTTFVDANPKPATSANANASSPVAPIDSSVSMPTQSSAVGAEVAANGSPAQLLLPSSNPSLPSPNSINASPQVAPTPSSTSTQAAASPKRLADSSAATRQGGFGVLDLTTPVAEREGKLGQHRDGRVRNPVPRKLKGKTDQRNGNFAVMHMDMSGSNADKIPRGEAAQRASENTARAARSALQDSYRVKRRRVEDAGWQPAPTPVRQALPQLQAHPHIVPSSPQVEPVHRTQAMSSEETKYEQARLLTLLRSISPLAVVDQVCKALAFFGGIPGAPAPEDDVFPASADANGSGSLFVGWLSEIFPELERKAWRPTVPRPPREVSRGKRPRGRPKGSKATKVRKDKGIKKGPKDPNREESGELLASHHQLQPVSVPDEDEDDDVEEDDWVDIGESELILHDTNAGKATTNASSAFVPANRAGIDIIDLETEEFNEPEPLDPPTTANIGKRRPGRPRGSRNRPKEKDADGNEVPAVEVFSLNQVSAPSTSSPVMNMHPASSQTPTSQPKRKAGRPPGSKTKPKEPAVAADSVSPSLSRANRSAATQPAPPTSNGVISQPRAGSTSSVPEGLSAEELAVLEAFRRSKNIESAAQPGAGKPAEKRKRTPRKPSNGQTTENAAAMPVAAPIPQPTGTPVVATQQLGDSSKANPQQGTPKSTSAAPPPKRQRKSKDLTAGTSKVNAAQDVAMPKSTTTPTPASAPVARAAPVTSSQRPVSVPTTVFSSAPIASEQVIAPTRPPAQGLQAHYDRFASIQQQQQQKQQQQQQQPQQLDNVQTRQDQQSIARSSPLQNPAFYQQQRHIPTPYAQYQTHQSSRTYHSGPNPQMDAYRATNNQHPQQQQQQQHNTFSPRQQQQHAQQSFTHFTDPSFIDLPALESAGGGAGQYGQQGQGIGRSNGHGDFGNGGGGGMGKWV